MGLRSAIINSSFSIIHCPSRFFFVALVLVIFFWGVWVRMWVGVLCAQVHLDLVGEFAERYAKKLFGHLSHITLMLVREIFGG
jgi:hypothetical protein